MVTLDPSRLVLGTAQFGMAYGVTNRQGQVSEDEARGILADASDAGVRMLDTAAGYGTSEAVLGRCLTRFPELSVVTKTPAFSAETITTAEVTALRTNLERSLAALGRTRVEALLLHHGRDMLKPGGEGLADALQAAKSAGLVRRVGVSVYDAAELDGVLARFRPDIVQLPLNLFDQRMIVSGHVARLKAEGVEIHARSPFLQGVLLAEAAGLPPFFARYQAYFAKYGERLARMRLTRLEACLGFALAKSEADRAVAGVAGRAELRQILTALGSLSGELPDFADFSVDDPALVDPQRWRPS